jgi:hypothetical protein
MLIEQTLLACSSGYSARGWQTRIIVSEANTVGVQRKEQFNTANFKGKYHVLKL